MKYFKISILLLLWYTGAVAQKADSVKLYQTFVQVCNAYKQLPLQLSVTCITTTNIPVHGEDSVKTNAAFFVQNNAAYIQFGNAEQLITDSMMLFVTKENNQMVLQRGAVNIAEQMVSMLRLASNDTATERFLQRYQITQKKIEDSINVLDLTSRQNAFQTSLPTETVKLIYNSNNKNPILVETVKRSLVKKPEAYTSPAGVTVITTPTNEAYLLREEKASYSFTKIEHDPSAAIPVLLKDRVTKGADNNFTPVPAYKNFNLIQH